MRLFFWLFCCLFTAGASAQFGSGVYYNINRLSAPDLPSRLDIADFDVYNAAELTLYYWFRLPKQRVEFQPSVYYAHDLGETVANTSEVGFQFKTNIYVFDLGTDCHCPTFGKQGPQLQKGFFVQLSPGVANGRYLGQDRRTVATLGAGVGLDIGISNLVTITPLLAYRRTLSSVANATWTDDDGSTLTDVSFRRNTFQLGLQATFRLDRRNY